MSQPKLLQYKSVILAFVTSKSCKDSDADKPALKQQLDQVLLEEKVLNILVGAVTGFGETMVTKESLAAAADQMRAAYNAVSGVALIPAAPFAAAKELPPEVWKAIGILLKAGQ